MKKIFIACDTKNIKQLKKIIKNSTSNKIKIGYKIGLEFFCSKQGRSFISSMKNKVIFLDLKLNDIPNTCVEAINSLSDLKNIEYLTVHINGGYEMLKAIKKGWFPPLPRVNNCRSMVHVDDLVEAIYFVSNETKANNEIFNVTDGKTYSSREIYDAMCYSLGKPIPKWEVPLFVFKIIALISKKKRISISKLLGDESYSSKKIQTLGFKVKRSLKEMNETSF